MRLQVKLFLYTLALVVSFWLFDSVLDYYFFEKGALFTEVLWDASIHETYSRLLMVLSIFAGGFVTSSMLAKKVDLQRELNEKDARFRAIVERSNDAVIMYDLNGVITYASPSVEAVFGYIPEETIGTTMGDYVSEASQKVLETAMRTVASGESISALETEAIHQDGHTLVVEVSSDPIYAGETVIAGQSIVRDVSEKKQIERETKRQLDFLQSIMDAVPSPLFYKDRNGVYLGCNRAFAEVLGRSRQDLLGKTAFDMGPKEIAQKHHELDQELIQNPGHQVYEWKVVNGKGEERDVLFHKTTYGNHNGGVAGLIGIMIDITERKRIEDALRETNKKLELVLRGAKLGFWVLDYASDKIEVNNYWAEILGYRVEEIGDEPSILRELTHPDDWPQVQKSIESHVSQVTDQHEIEFRMRCRSGQWKWVLSWGQVVERTKDGNPLKAAGIHIDITERKRSEQAYKQKSDELGERVKELHCLTQLLQMTQEECESLDGLLSRIVRLLPPAWQYPDLTAAQITIHDREFKTENYVYSPWQLSAPIICEGKIVGRVIVSYASEKPESDEGPFSREERVLLNAIAFHIGDFIERHAARTELQMSEEKYRSLVNSMPYGVSMISADLEILSLNSKMKEWFPNVDVNRKPICHRALHAPPSDSPCSYCPVLKTFEDGDIHEAVTETPTPNGIINYRLQASPIRNVQNEIIAVIETVEDVTQKLRIEQELINADRLASISVLAGGIAHDFNNLLMAISGNLTLATIDMSTEDSSYSHLKEASLAAQRAQSLTRQLLTFSKGNSLSKKEANIADIIKETVGFTLSSTNSSCDIEVNGDLYKTFVDEGQMVQVIQNLLINADQAMPNGGNITITLENRKVGQNGDSPVPPGNYVRITVRDEGVGMSEDVQRKIFDPFFTTKEKGNGLGLATTYSIIQQHEGHIQVASRVGWGTTFEIYLPAVNNSQSTAEPSTMESDSPRTDCSGRVLVMDDGMIVRRLTSDYLTNMGYEVKTVADGESAIKEYQAAREAAQPYDVVLLDLCVSGGMGGRDVLQKIKVLDDEVKAIAASGFLDDTIRRELEAVGFVSCLVKPYDKASLARVLATVLEPRSEVST